MADLHFILQGKGGVGKSVIASWLSQYLIEKDNKVMCIDSDPQNATLHGYKALDSTLLPLLADDNKIDSQQFDKLLTIFEENNDSSIVFDNGASSFIEFSSYVVSNMFFDVLSELGHKVTVHTVIYGGQSLPDTITGFHNIATQYPENVDMVVWLNPHDGKIVNSDGEAFEDMAVYDMHKQRINGLINIPELDQLFSRAVSKMLKQRLTFNEVSASTEFEIMEKQRVKIFKAKLFPSIAAGLVK